MTATSGRMAASRARMSCSALRSAWQTGEPSGLRRASISAGLQPDDEPAGLGHDLAERGCQLVARFHFHDDSKNSAPSAAEERQVKIGDSDGVASSVGNGGDLWGWARRFTPSPQGRGWGEGVTILQNRDAGAPILLSRGEGVKCSASKGGHVEFAREAPPPPCRKRTTGWQGAGWTIKSSNAHAGHGRTALRSHHDRSALLDHAERPQDHDLPRGGRRFPIGSSR